MLDCRSARIREAQIAAGQSLLSDFHPTDGDAVAPPAGRTSTSLAVLLTRHILRDGELVLLILRPSLWFIPLSALRFVAVVLILLCTALVLEPHLPWGPLQYLELAVLALAGRIGWAVLQWMNRLYILTDLRILRLSGVFNVEIFDCPLRRVARTFLLRPFKERLCRVGTILIIPQEEACAASAWQMITRPREIHQQIDSAIRRAKHTGMMMRG